MPMNGEVVGVIPAAGCAHRIAPLPCSKELFPIGFRDDVSDGEPRPKVATHYLLDKFKAAGVHTAYVVVRNGKWDIPAYFGDGAMAGVNLSYLVVADSLGPADTVDRAFPFVRDKVVAFGFPDIVFEPENVFERLLEQLSNGAEAVIGLCPPQDVRASDMVKIDSHGRVRGMVLKPAGTTLRYSWLCAVWRPAMTEFLHHFVEGARLDPQARRTWHGLDSGGDLPIGAALKAAVEQGIHVQGCVLPTESFIDIGTPHNLVKAVHRFLAEPTAERL
jgi:NDP-sugar pyrophosphorylase family protein